MDLQNLIELNRVIANVNYVGGNPSQGITRDTLALLGRPEKMLRSLWHLHKGRDFSAFPKGSTLPPGCRAMGSGGPPYILPDEGETF